MLIVLKSFLESLLGRKLNLNISIKYDSVVDIIEEIVEEGNWVEEANQRIDKLRKSNITFHFNFDSSINMNDLSLEFEQKTHKFPFGTAVVSTRIAECFDSNQDDNYCSFVRDNFNWMVDSYR